jgi:hypothetical protein
LTTAAAIGEHPPPMTLAELTARLRVHVGTVRKRYPHAWEQLAAFRADKGSKELGDWPSWCWVPLAGAMAVVSEGRDELAMERAGDVGIVGALAAWRMTQGIYQFDDTLIAALWDTSLEGELPVEVLYHLPEWCVYVPTPGRTFSGAPLVGFFAHLEHDTNDKRTERTRTGADPDPAARLDAGGAGGGGAPGAGRGRVSGPRTWHGAAGWELRGVGASRARLCAAGVAGALSVLAGSGDPGPGRQ